MKRFSMVLGAAILSWGTHALADGTALVIGNGRYANAPRADTAERDANAVATALREAGWTVLAGNNLDRAGMRKLINQFGAAAEGSDKLAVFYSGHALRTGGVTYLAPVKAQNNSLTDVMFDGVPLDLVLTIAADQPGKAVVFLDGAQLRGFKPMPFAEPGLADLEGPEGVLIVSAAPPGQAVRRSAYRDSRFARLIADQFLKPGAGVGAVAEAAERPTWVTGSVDEDFVLAPPPAPVSDGLEAEIERVYWFAAERSGASEDYQLYLTRYPQGIYADEARRRLGLDANVETIPEEPKVDPIIQAERDLNLSRIRKRQIQTWLHALGHDPNGIDGLFGRGTRKAIGSWQRKAGFEPNQWLTAEQLSRLQVDGEAALVEQRRIAEEQRLIREAEDNAFWSATGAKGKPAGYRAYLQEYPEGLHAKIARAALAKIAEAEADIAARNERRVFRRAKKQDSAAAYRDYLGAYPKGIYRDEALARLDEIEGAERLAAELDRLKQSEDALELSANDQLSVEQRLRSLGFEVGPLDGVFDERTRSGIKGYQSSRGIGDTGYLDRPTVVTLVRETNKRQPSGGQVQIDGAQVIRGLIDALGNR